MALDSFQPGRGDDLLNWFQRNKLETIEDALFEGSKTSPHKTEKKLDADLLPCGKRCAEKVKGWSSLNG